MMLFVPDLQKRNCILEGYAAVYAVLCNSTPDAKSPQGPTDAGTVPKHPGLREAR